MYYVFAHFILSVKYWFNALTLLVGDRNHIWPEINLLQQFLHVHFLVHGITWSNLKKLAS